jgi:hypothetical protein
MEAYMDNDKWVLSEEDIKIFAYFYNKAINRIITQGKFPEEFLIKEAQLNKSKPA